MLPLIVLKILGDLGFYFSFSGLFAVILGADPNMILISIAVMAAVFTASFQLENTEKLRFAVLLPALLTVLLPGCCPAFVIVMLPPWAYLIMCAKNRSYYPTWSGAVDLVSMFWKVMIPFTVMSFVTRCTDTLIAITFPCAVITFCCCIMLSRSLRHDIDVFASPLYQALNIGTAGALLLGTMFISSQGFRSAAGSVLKTLYTHSLMQVLLWLTQMFTYVVFAAATAIVWILRFFHIEGEQVPEYETIFGESSSDGLYAEYDPNAHPWFKIISVIVIVGAALYAAYKIFQKLQGTQTRRMPAATGETESRSFVMGSRFKHTEDDNGLTEKLRAQYRKFLKLYLKHNYPLEKFFTSQNICDVSAKTFDPHASQKLRQLYLKARYAGRAEQEDVAAAKELVKELKKSSEL